MNFLKTTIFGGVKEIPESKKYTDQYFYDQIKDTNLLVPRTKMLYTTKLQLIQQQLFGSNSHPSLLWILLHPQETKEAIIKHGQETVGRFGHKTLSAHTLKQLCLVIASLLFHNQELQEHYPELMAQWKQLTKEISAPVTEHYDSNQPTETQAKAYISFEEIEKIRDGLKDGSTDKLLVSIYTMIPPARSDYDRVRIYGSDPDVKTENYMVIDKEGKITMYLNQYKTAKNYGSLITSLPPALCHQIIKSLELNPREYLFVDHKNQPYVNTGTFNSFANRSCKRIFNNKDFNLTMFRHIYVSRKSIMDKSRKEKKEIATKMGHSLDMADQYAFKGDDKQ